MGTKSDQRMIFIDSNIWCYYFDRRLPEHNLVRETMRQNLLNEELVCNTIVAMEVAHYLVRHFDKSTAQKKIEYFIHLSNMRIVDFGRRDMEQALENLIEYGYDDGLGGRDAGIVAAMKSSGIKTIFSHDAIFKRLSAKFEIEVMDPTA